MRGNIVLAAAVFGLGVVLGAGVMVLGVRWALVDAADRLNVAIDRHAQMTQSAGDRAGQPIQAALGQLSDRVSQHSDAIKQAGQTIGHATVKLDGPVPIVDHLPIRIQGTRGDDRSLPVDVQVQAPGK
jgi:hypothetical protein